MTTQTQTSTTAGTGDDEPLPCSSLRCDKPAAEVLSFRGQIAHVHDCTQHAALVREWCDVTASAPIINGRCPVPGCADAPIWVGKPTPLGGDDA